MGELWKTPKASQLGRYHFPHQRISLSWFVDGGDGCKHKKKPSGQFPERVARTPILPTSESIKIEVAVTGSIVKIPLLLINN